MQSRFKLSHLSLAIVAASLSPCTLFAADVVDAEVDALSAAAEPTDAIGAGTILKFRESSRSLLKPVKLPLALKTAIGACLDDWYFSALAVAASVIMRSLWRRNLLSRILSVSPKFRPRLDPVSSW